MSLNSIEICAGAGGQALGLERAGFDHVNLVEIEAPACQTLRINRKHWHVTEGDIRHYSAEQWQGIELFAGGVPCPPFSKAGKQLGDQDERDLFPEALRLVAECKPQAIMLENVRGLLDAIFDEYRTNIITDLKKLGYLAEWRLLNASDFGVPQLRPRVVFVALKKEAASYFNWPSPLTTPPPTVGEALFDLMALNGWQGAKPWQERACDIAPTLVGGSKKHGGPDLGPTRAKKAWASLGVDGMGIADGSPAQDFVGMPAYRVFLMIGNLAAKKPPPTDKSATPSLPPLLALSAHKSAPHLTPPPNQNLNGRNHDQTENPQRWGEK